MHRRGEPPRDARAEDARQHLVQREDHAEPEDAGGGRDHRLRSDEPENREEPDRQLRHPEDRREDARHEVQRQGKAGGEKCRGGEPRAEQRARRHRQRPENRRVPRIQGEPVPAHHRDQRHQQHGRAAEQEEVVQRSDGRPPGRLQRAEEILRRDDDARERAQADERGARDGQHLVPVGLRRQQVVVEEPPQEVADQQPATHGSR